MLFRRQRRDERDAPGPGTISQPAYGHGVGPPPVDEHGGESSRYIGPVVYGGLDGVVTTFAIVSGVAGAALGSDVVLVLGLANLLADGVSMSAGAFLSARSEAEYYERERQVERRQVEVMPEAELSELNALLRAQGYDRQEAEQMTEIQSRDEERLVDAMMVQELGLVREERHPGLIGLATFVAFVVAGAVPLVAYLVGLFVPIGNDLAFAIASVLTGVALFGLGAARVLVTERNWLRSGLEMLVVGGVAAAVAYVVGFLLAGQGG